MGDVTPPEGGTNTDRRRELMVGQFHFDGQEGGPVSLESAVFQALGAASVCWDSESRLCGFESDACKAIGDALVVEIERQRPVPDAGMRRRAASEIPDVHVENFLRRVGTDPRQLARMVLAAIDGEKYWLHRANVAEQGGQR